MRITIPSGFSEFLPRTQVTSHLKKKKKKRKIIIKKMKEGNPPKTGSCGCGALEGAMRVKPHFNLCIRLFCCHTFPLLLNGARIIQSQNEVHSSAFIVQTKFF